MNELTKIEAGAVAPMSAVQVREQVALINDILKNVMVPKVHFDKLPGCAKPTLLKPGAEKILTTFRIGSEPQIEYTTNGFDHFYKVVARGFHIPTGNTVGYGVGICSTDEDKFKWRAAICPEEFDATPEAQRRIHWYKDGGKAVSVQQVRQNPANVRNTVLKMAKKRAEVDLCRTATACSDVFEQDIDEDHIAAAVGVDTAPRYTAPRRRTATPAAAPAPQPGEGVNVITDAQKRRLYAIGKERGLSKSEMTFIIRDVAGVTDSRKIPVAIYEAVVSAYQQAKPGEVTEAGL